MCSLIFYPLMANFKFEFSCTADWDGIIVWASPEAIMSLLERQRTSSKCACYFLCGLWLVHFLLLFFFHIFQLLVPVWYLDVEVNPERWCQLVSCRAAELRENCKCWHLIDPGWKDTYLVKAAFILFTVLCFLCSLDRDSLLLMILGNILQIDLNFKK